MLRPGNVHSAHNWREVLDPIVARYGRTGVRRYFRADAAFAKPEVYEYLEERRVLYAIRLPSNEVLQWEIAPLLRRPVGRPPKKPIIWYDDFWYQAGSWDRPRRVIAKVEWHQGGQALVVAKPPGQTIKIGGRLVRHARRLVFQLAEVAVPREVFRQVLERIGGLHAAPG